MLKMRKSLSVSQKGIRHRRRMINIHVTFLAWIVELLSGLVFLIGTHVIGHENNIVNYSLNTISLFIEFVVLPSIFLINDSDLKAQMMETTWYNNFLNIFNWQYINQSEKDNDPNADEHQQHVPDNGNQNLNDPPEHEISNENDNNQNIENHENPRELNTINSAQINPSDCEVIDLEDGENT